MTRLDITDQTFTNDPYQTYRWLRDNDPVHFDEEHGLCVLSRYKDVSDALLDHATFSSAKGNGVVDSAERIGRTLGTTDPPRHDDLRRIFNVAFKPERLKAQTEIIRTQARQLIGEFSAAKSGDAVGSIIRPITSTLVMRLIGVDLARAAEVGEIAGRVLDETSQSAITRQPPRSGQAVFQLLREELEKKRSAPADDLMTFLLNAEIDGMRLTDEEIVTGLTTALIAGFASLSHFMSNVVNALWLHPEQRRQVLADLSLVDAVIEETSRWDTATQGFARHVTRDVTIEGKLVPAGTRALLLYASANRDEREFEAADRFDISRKRGRHMGFGYGVHRCIGAPLATLAARTVLTEILPVLGNYSIDLAQSRRAMGLQFRGFDRFALAIG